MIEFFRRASAAPRRLGILPGTFNPPTRAHLALARAAQGHVDEVLFVLPREFPHKAYEGASFAERIEMLRVAVADDPLLSIASTDRGLFIDIARDCRDAYGDAALSFLCGRDAAERIVNWDYGAPGSLRRPCWKNSTSGWRPAAAIISRPRNWRIAFIRFPWLRITTKSPRPMCATGSRAACPGSTLVPEAIVPLVRRIYRPTNR